MKLGRRGFLGWLGTALGVLLVRGLAPGAGAGEKTWGLGARRFFRRVRRLREAELHEPHRWEG